MLQIYSDIEKSVLLHTIYKRSDFIEGRFNISPDEEFLQVSALTLQSGQTFRPHKHISKKIDYTEMITAENWIIISGKVRVFLYDLNDKVILEADLGPGDMTMTFRGGHNYMILEDNTIIYETKSGPYFGQKLDKVFIN